MSGSVYPYTLKSGQRRWGFCVYLTKRPVWDAEKGRKLRPQLRRQGYLRKLDAERALEEELPGIRRGRAPTLADRRLTVSEWADKWLESKVSIRPATRAGYRQIVETYVKPGIGDIELMEVRPKDLDDLLALVREGKLRPKRNRRDKDGKLRASTIRQIAAVTTVMFGAAVKRRLIQSNPMVGVELEQPEERDDVTWSVAEADTFLALAQEREPRLAIAFRISLSYSLRRGELAARWEDVSDDWLCVRQNLPAVTGKREFGPPKTRAAKRDIPLALDPGFAAALREHRKAQLADRLAAGAA